MIKLRTVFLFLVTTLVVAAPPKQVDVKTAGACYQLSLTASALDAETRARLEGECKMCVPPSAKPGEVPTFQIALEGKSKGKGTCVVKKVAMLPRAAQLPGGSAGFRCAGLFPKSSSECQTCVGGQGAWVEWADGKSECAKKPAGPATREAECVWAGKEQRACSDCTFEKKKWSLSASACE